MRRHIDHDISPNHKRSHRHVDSDRNTSPRRSHRDNHKTASYSRHRPRSPSSQHGEERTKSNSAPSYNTVYVRKFSSKLSIEVIQDCLFREFDKFGELSISVGHLDGERAALIAFKHSSDAREAYRAKPKVYLKDRYVNVEILRDSITSEEPRPKVSRSDHDVLREANLSGDSDSQFDTYSAPKMVDNGLVELLSKSASMTPCATNSLLGVPGMNPSAMMAAAAARALGLTGPPVSITEPPPNFPLYFPNQQHVGSRFVGSAPHRFDHSVGGRSSPISGVDKDLKATRTLFVGSLEPDITETEVRDAFSRFGHVEQIDIKRAPKVGTNAYAFIRYENVDMAYRARNTMSGRRVRSLHCKIGYGKPIPSHCLYISGLSRRMRDEAVNQLFVRFGPVEKLDWSQSRGCAHVRYATLDSACNANNQLRGLSFEDDRRRRLRVDFINGDVMQFGIDEKRDRDYYSARNCINTDDTTNSEGTMNSDRQENLLGQKPSTAERSTRRFAGSNHKTITDSGKTNPLTLQSVTDLSELDNCLQPEIWKGQLLLRNNQFNFRCLHVVGDAEISSYVGRVSNFASKSTTDEDTLNPILRITQRGQVDDNWMEEITNCVQAVLSNRQRGLCIMLLLPDSMKEQSLHEQNREVTNPQDKKLPLPTLVAYFKLKQAIGIVIPTKHLKTGENDTENRSPLRNLNKLSLSLHLFAPNNFSLGLLKMAAPSLNPELTTSDLYMVLLAIKQ